MHTNQSSYNRWSWIVALILALVLLWMLLTGRGPSNACCTAPVEAAAPVEEIMPAPEPTAIPQTFGFSATANDFSSNGDSTNVSWFSKSGELKALLASGDALQAQGDDKSVVLRGTVDSEAIKEQKGADAQAFFGPAVTVDNQILVKAAEPVVLAPPPAAKLYFDTGKTALPNNSDTTLAPIIEWLKTHDTTKAVLSGYHDSRGNKAVNEELAKNRAKSVREALKTAGIDETRIEMRKPESVDGGGDLTEARRVEVSVE
jgi:outer membrane protein OmpA-like peptidoglycan-associated protein